MLEIYMNKIIFTVLLAGLSLNTYAVDQAIINLNNSIFEIKRYVEVIKDKTTPQVIRQREFSNLANEFSDPAGNWDLLKVSVLDIINTDVEFWSQEIKNYPAVQEKLINDFSLDWYQDTTSNYEQKQQLSIVEISKRMEDLEIEKKMLKELLGKLKSVKPTTL